MIQYTVKITYQAKEQLNAIKQYISYELQQPKTAKNMLNSLRLGILSLSEMPHRAKKLEDQPWKKLGFRKIRIKNYYVYFWIDEKKKCVHIIAVIYTKMNQETQLQQLNSKH